MGGVSTTTEGAIVVADSARQKRLSLKASLWAAVGALLGVIIGRLLAPKVLELFGGSPVWVAPAVIIGLVAFLLVVFLLVPHWLRKQQP
jgi:MFS family permease